MDDDDDCRSEYVLYHPANQPPSPLSSSSSSAAAAAACVSVTELQQLQSAGTGADHVTRPRIHSASVLQTSHHNDFTRVTHRRRHLYTV